MSNKTSSPSPLIRALRSASPVLWPARLRLIGLKSAYKSGRYSGHPEDLLDRIDGNERLICQYKDGRNPAGSKAQ